eukprot:TRINITY_DN82142_c0_g1_i2.p1 TRINITY_DN82142_c0_g1~~TRINITY_DN82142_c0_g1_i2.p1  ORF type:complete len:642 (+),score=60.76 TRINITY_DN82142_c0_g1_i2:247-2172(+)
MEYPYFHGWMSKHEAEVVLRGHSNSFLVRFNQEHPGHYAISFSDVYGTYGHKSVSFDGYNFHFDDVQQYFGSLDEAVENLGYPGLTGIAPQYGQAIDLDADQEHEDLLDWQDLPIVQPQSHVPQPPPDLCTEVDQLLKDELTCSICLDLYKEPHKLDCDHSFCLHCLAKLVGEGWEIRCPECRQTTRVSSKGLLGVASLPLDRKLSRLVTKLCEKQGAETQPGHVEDQSFYCVQKPQFFEEFREFVPFRLEPYDCARLFEQWKASIWLAPREFALKASKLHNLSLIFVPFYCFSLTTATSYKATVTVYDGKQTQHNVQRQPPANFRPPPPLVTPALASTDMLSDGSPVPEAGRRGHNTHQRWVAQQVGLNCALPFEERSTKGKVMTSATNGMLALLGTTTWTLPSWRIRDKSQVQCRTVDIVGTHSNSYMDMLCCASNVLNADLLQELQQTIDQDVPFLSSMSIPLPTAVQDPSNSFADLRPEDYLEYVRCVERMVFDLSQGSRRAVPAPVDEDDWEEVPRAASCRRSSVTVPELPPQAVWIAGVFERVKARESEFTKNFIQGNKQHQSVENCTLSMSITSLDYRCVLLPFYTGYYNHEGIDYDVIIHARSGAVSAKRPWLGSSYRESLRTSPFWDKLKRK